MQPTGAGPDWPVVSVAVIAFVIAQLDATDTILAVLSPEPTGRIGGTLFRDALLVVGGAYALRRANWARWLLGVLFGLTLLRTLVADELSEFAGVALAVVGIALLLHPRSRAWFRREASEGARHVRADDANRHTSGEPSAPTAGKFVAENRR